MDIMYKKVIKTELVFDILNQEYFLRKRTFENSSLNRVYSWYQKNKNDSEGNEITPTGETEFKL